MPALVALDTLAVAALPYGTPVQTGMLVHENAWNARNASSSHHFEPAPAEA
jgi:hypothetical protein